MSDRRTILLLGSRRCITPRKERFSYDMRGDSQVNIDIVAAYYLVPQGPAPLEVGQVVEHAREHDAILTSHVHRTVPCTS